MKLKNFFPIHCSSWFGDKSQVTVLFINKQMNASFSLCSEVNYSKTLWTSKNTGGIILTSNNRSQKEVTKKVSFLSHSTHNTFGKNIFSQNQEELWHQIQRKEKICLSSVNWWVENYFLTEFATICENALNIFLKTFNKNTLSFLFNKFVKH